MLRNTQSLAINLIRGLYETAEGRPMQWRSLDDFNLPQTAKVVRYATTRGWMVTCGEREQGLPYRCRLASDRIAVAIRLWQQPAARASADGIFCGALSESGLKQP